MTPKIKCTQLNLMDYLNSQQAKPRAIYLWQLWEPRVKYWLNWLDEQSYVVSIDSGWWLSRFHDDFESLHAVFRDVLKPSDNWPVVMWPYFWERIRPYLKEKLISQHGYSIIE